MHNRLISALNALNVRDLSYQEWMNVGMALKHEGFTSDVWDDWSKNDDRYHPGECARKWDTFRGSENPVTGATIVQMAKSRGWKLYDGSGAMAWNDTITYDGKEDAMMTQTNESPVSQLTRYLTTLYRPDEYVGYVTGDVFQNEDGDWQPKRGVFSQTAGELLTALSRYPDDLGAAVGDWKPDAVKQTIDL